MGQLDKLIERVLNVDPNLRFEDLCKVLREMGYTAKQPGTGGSHYTFRKAGCKPITIPRHTPINKTYIRMVAEVIRGDSEEG